MRPPSKYGIDAKLASELGQAIESNGAQHNSRGSGASVKILILFKGFSALGLDTCYQLQKFANIVLMIL